MEKKYMKETLIKTLIETIVNVTIEQGVVFTFESVKNIISNIIKNYKISKDDIDYIALWRIGKSLKSRFPGANKNDYINQCLELYDKIKMSHDYYKKQYHSPSLIEGYSINEIYVKSKCKEYFSFFDSRNSYNHTDKQIEEWINENDFGLLLLLGEPGQGKSSFCKYFANENIERNFINECKAEDVFLFKLNPAESNILKDGNLNILYAFHSRINDNVFSANELENCIVLLDGYDELWVSLIQIGITTLGFFKQLIELAKQYNIFFVITSRKSCLFKKDLKALSGNGIDGLKHIKIFELVDWEETEQSEYIKKYNEKFEYSLISNNHMKKCDEVKFFNTIRQNEQLKKLAKVPLLAQLIISYDVLNLVNNRAELYKQIFKKATRNPIEIGIQSNLSELYDLYSDIALEIFNYNDQNVILEINEGNSPIKYLFLVAFYVQTYNENNSYRFEFLHRSFYQYFLAWKLLILVSECSRDKKNVSKLLTALAGRLLEPDVLTMAKEIYNLEYIDSIDKVRFNKIIHNIFEVLSETEALFWDDKYYLDAIKNDELMKVETIKLKRANNIVKNIFNFLSYIFSDEDFQDIIINNNNKIDNMLLLFNISEADLRILRFYDLKSIKKQNLNCINLKAVKSEYIDLSGSDLTEANLDEVKFTFAKLTNANLNKAQLNGARLNYSYLTEANLSEIKTSNMNSNIELIESHLENAILIKADLQRADLRGIYLNGANLKGANLKDADLRGARLRDVDFSTVVDVNGANFREAEYLDGKTINYLLNRGAII